MSESWKEKRNRLCLLIKELSDLYGGDERDWLIDYCQEIINQYKDNLDTPLACFTDLVNQKKKVIMV